MITPSKFKEDIEANFGKLNLKQIWLIVKIAKHVRLRCRNNTAFNNFFNQIIPQAYFKQVIKTRQDGSTYPGLSISTGNNEEIIENEEE